MAFTRRLSKYEQPDEAGKKKAKARRQINLLLQVK